ncbi:hypothetical protein SOCEGT47_034740 [Sorangium cellulosum]|uniref:Uncharacterized protein n=1 Tax=Sorangium cellulosum TaxID=56 RepID=A0A4P2Q1Y2_SORCE|nr:hypothetical protein SOCEGT47_034740 [Sorangium cellulosum]
MQKPKCTASAHASGDGTRAEKLVRRASPSCSSLRSLVVESVVPVALLAGLAIPALVGPVGIVGLIRVGDGCGPPL